MTQPLPKTVPFELIFQGQVKELARAIFRGDVSNTEIKAIPPALVYAVVCELGIDSSVDLINALSPQQHSLLLDLSLWDKDTVDEQRLWALLAVMDDAQSLLPLQRFLKAVDTKILGLLIRRHIQTETFEEPTDNPPGDGFYTPDRGYTWIRINIEDSEQHRLFGRMLALLFQISPDVFHQILNSSFAGTSAEMEEGALADRGKRLQSFGIPDYDEALELHAQLSPAGFKNLQVESSGPVVNELELATISGDEEFLSAALNLLSADEQRQFAADFIRLFNSAIVRYSLDLSERRELQDFAERIKTSASAALKYLSVKTSQTPENILRQTGLIKLYRLGLTLSRPSETK